MLVGSWSGLATDQDAPLQADQHQRGRPHDFNDHDHDHGDNDLLHPGARLGEPAEGGGDLGRPDEAWA